MSTNEKPSLFDAVSSVLKMTDPNLKTEAVVHVREQWMRGEYALISSFLPENECVAGRPEKPELVHPRNVPRRKLNTDEGRAALVHAICHIEFNAINLALDAVQRFQGMPKDYYSDWLRVAEEESRHFKMLQSRLHDLGYQYGSFVAHNGLWEMAVKTCHSVIERMALVPRVLEARGLDVTPGLIKRLDAIKDFETVEIFNLILKEEVDHVRVGTRWFYHACREEGVDAEKLFVQLLEKYEVSANNTNLHYEARKQAGFSETELRALTEN